jgi:hypothetical protein
MIRQVFGKSTVWVTLALLAFMAATPTRSNAQLDTAGNSAPANRSPTGEFRRSGSLTLFAGFQQGLHTKQEQAPQDARTLVGVAPNIRLGDHWELSPEIGMWRIPVHYHEQWNLKVGLLVHWFALARGQFSAFALGGPAILFAGWPFVTLDVGGGIRWTLSPAVALSVEVRTCLYYHTSEVHSPMILASPMSMIVGVRLTSP